MNEKQRIENMNFYHKKIKSLGWVNENLEDKWPNDPESLAEQARERFGFELMNSMDTTFIDFKNRLEENRNLSNLSKEQKESILEEYDELLDCVVYNLSMLFDRFEHGVLEIRHGKPNEDEELIDPVVIHPHGFLEMIQDSLRWKEEYSRGKNIGRKTE
jgi:hypothetical protein